MPPSPDSLEPILPDRDRAAEVDPARLGAFLRAALPPLGLDPGAADPALERIGGGQSNPTFFVTCASGLRLVLRKQPAGPVLPSAHAVDREARVMTALRGTTVPVPRVVLFHAGREVVGTPFYLMERLDGRVFHDAALPGLTPPERRAAYADFARTLAALHALDVEALGLADYGRAGDYFARQTARWTKQWQASRGDYRGPGGPAIDALAAWLPAHGPKGDDAALVHGDYRPGNVMFHASEPRVIAVLDWELSTLGHPLADAAFSCLPWLSKPDWYGGIQGLDLAALGLPSLEEHLATYHDAAGRGPGRRVEAPHLVFALFRFAVILAGVGARATAGNAASADGARVGALAGAYADTALDLARTA